MNLVSIIGWILLCLGGFLLGWHYDLGAVALGVLIVFGCSLAEVRK